METVKSRRIGNNTAILTDHDDPLQELRRADTLPEKERVFKTVDAPVFGQSFVESGYRSQEQDGVDLCKVGQPSGSL